MNAPKPVPSPAGSGDARSYEPSMEEILASIRRIIADDQSLPGRVRAEPAREAVPHVSPLRDTAQQEPTLGVPSPEAASPVAHDPVSVETRGTEMPPVADQPRDIQAANESVVAHSTPINDAMAAHGSIAPQYESRETSPVESHVAATSSSDRLDAIHRRVHAEPVREETAAHGDGADYFDPPEEHDRPAATSVDAGSLFSATTNSSVTSAFKTLAATRLADNSEELLAIARDVIRPLLRSWLDENLPSMVERLVRDEIERVARGG